MGAVFQQEEELNDMLAPQGRIIDMNLRGEALEKILH